MLIALLIATLSAGAVPGTTPAQAAVQPAACRLLALDEIRAVQGTVPVERKATAERARGLVFDQCVFRVTDFVHSVSLTVIRGNPGVAPDGARAFWTKTFHPAPRPAPASGRVPKKKEPPRAIAGMGHEAFWTGDPRTGSLYVLDGDVVLRVSVGGVADEQERIRRSTTLARAALGRLNAE